MRIEQLAMFNFDIAVVTVFLIIAIYWKEQRAGFLSGAALYLSISLLWHLYPWQ